MVTILILIVVLIVGKFIYDTYLTNNTKKRFEVYRRNDPIGAATIEKPKTDEQFNDLVEAIDNEMSRTRKKNPSIVSNPTIRDLFPNFHIYYLTQIKNLKLELVKDDNVYFEYRMPVSVHGKIKGYNYIGIGKAQDFFVMYVKCCPVNDKEFHGDIVKLERDMPLTEYNKSIDNMCLSLVENPKYVNMYMDEHNLNEENERNIDFNTISKEDFEIVINFFALKKMYITNLRTSEIIALKLSGFIWHDKDDKICTFKTEPDEKNPFNSNEFELNKEQFESYCIDANKIRDKMYKLTNL